MEHDSAHRPRAAGDGAESRPELTRLPSQSGSHAVSWLELFGDLVFVFGITQLSHLFIDDPTLASLGLTVLLGSTIWLIWVHTAFVTNWLQPAHPAVRIMLLAMSLVALVQAAAIPDALGAGGVVFGAGVAVIEVGRSVFAACALRGTDPDNARNFVRITVWRSIAGVGWVVGGLLDPTSRLVVWTLAVLFELAGPAAMYWVPGLGSTPVPVWTVSAAHIAERAGQFVTIVLGETVLVTGAAFADRGTDPVGVLALITAFTSTVLYAMLYFGRAAARTGRRFTRSGQNAAIARASYIYLHLPLVLAILLSATADALMLTGTDPGSAVLAGVLAAAAPALFVLSLLLFSGAAGVRPNPAAVVGVVVLAVIAVLVGAAGTDLGGLASPITVSVLADAVLVAVLLLGGRRSAAG